MVEQGNAVEQGPAEGSDEGRRPRSAWVKAISGTVVALLVAVAGIFAYRADGTPVHDVGLTDGGVWVSGGAGGHWGRVNTGAHSLDMVVTGAGRTSVNKKAKPDVLQDGRNVVGVTTDHELLAIDTRTGEPLGDPVEAPVPDFSQRSTIQEPDTVALRGGTIAVVDHENGNLWAKRLDPDGGTSLEGLMDTPLENQIGPKTTVTVSLDGDVMAVSAETGKVVTIPAEGDGFGKAEQSDLPFSGSEVADITAVGDQWVVLDLEEGKVYAEGEEQAQDAPEGGEGTRDESLAWATLQQPGPESDVVAVQTPSRAGLVRISESRSGGEGGIDTGLDPDGPRQKGIKLSRPVMNGDCLYAAWGNGNQVLWAAACGETNAKVNTLNVVGNATRPNGVAVRYNRGTVLLNDIDTGRILDLSLQGDIRIDTWPGGADRGRQERYTGPVEERSQSSTSTPTKSSTKRSSPKKTPKKTQKKKPSATSTAKSG